MVVNFLTDHYSINSLFINPLLALLKSIFNYTVKKNLSNLLFFLLATFTLEDYKTKIVSILNTEK